MKNSIINGLNKVRFCFLISGILFFFSCNRSESFKAFEIRKFILQSNITIHESIHQLNDSIDFKELSDTVDFITTSLKTLNIKPEITHEFITKEFTFLNEINSVLADSIVNYGDSLQRMQTKFIIEKLSEEFIQTTDQSIFLFESAYKLDKRTR